MLPSEETSRFSAFSEPKITIKKMNRNLTDREPLSQEVMAEPIIVSENNTLDRKILLTAREDFAKAKTKKPTPAEIEVELEKISPIK